MQSSDINARKMLKKSKSETNMKNSGGKASKNKENDAKFERICQFYATTLKLKTLLRSGWLQWKIDADRFESVAEHIYGTQMLAFAVISEFELDLDLSKVLMMLAFHELGETVIGDITMHDGVSKAKKHEMEIEAVSNILKPMKFGDKIFQLFDEFETRQTPEAKFSYMIDKFECDLQCKYYDEMGFADLMRELSGNAEEVRLERIKKGEKTFSEAWLNCDVENLGFDDKFKKFSSYVISHEIFKSDDAKH